MANNKSGFDRAKTDGEPALKRELERAPYDFPRGILQHVNLASEQFDKMLHIDLVAHYMIIDKNSTDSGSVDFCFIDLKDPDNITTGNVTIDIDEIRFFKNYRKKTSDYILAFRLNDGINRRYNMFRLFEVSDVLSYIDEKNPEVRNGGENNGYYLINMSDLAKSRPFFEVGSVK